MTTKEETNFSTVKQIPDRNVVKSGKKNPMNYILKNQICNIATSFNINA